MWSLLAHQGQVIEQGVVREEIKVLLLLNGEVIGNIGPLPGGSTVLFMVIRFPLEWLLELLGLVCVWPLPLLMVRAFWAVRA